LLSAIFSRTLNLKDIEMNTTWKQVLLVVAFAGPAVAIAADDASVREQSNHTTNKKAIAMEAKEDKAAVSAVRNWNAIDTNKDHSISPEEMEKFLTGVWNTKPKG
jgi:hypothetical protein